MDHKAEKTSSWLKRVIVLLAVLLVLSCVALAGRYVYRKYLAEPAVATVPDNLIEEDPAELETEDESQTPEEEGTASSAESTAGEASQDASGGQGESVAGTTGQSGANAARNNASGTQGAAAPAQTAGGTASSGTTGSETGETKATVIELYQGRPDANQKFEVGNMFPGDHITKYYCVRIYHDQPIDVFFHPEITEQTKSLGNGLKIAVTRLGQSGQLCNDTFSQVNGHSYSESFTQNEDGVTVLYYRVEVYADTSMGNEYQQASLKADFDWYVQDRGEQGTQAGAQTGGTNVTVNALTLPQTGDPFNVLLWSILAVSALLLAVLVYIQRKKETKKHG